MRPGRWTGPRLVAPGFQPAPVEAVVTGSWPDCGCPRIDTAQVEVHLVAAVP